MLNSLLVLLFDVSRCDSDWDSESSIDKAWHRDVILSKAACTDMERCTALASVRPFLCLSSCPRLDECTPYTQFDSIVEFCRTIPNSKKLGTLYKKNNVKELARLASKSDGCDNYDALNAFYYNADSHSGICPRKFDSNFISWFLVRFYFFMEMNEREATVNSNGEFRCNVSREPIDLLCPPCQFSELSFCDDKAPLHIFNTLMGNAAIGDFVRNFISILLRQICSATEKCRKETECEPNRITTYGVYSSLLREYLCRSWQISTANTATVRKFANSSLGKKFLVYIPYKTTTSTTTPAYSASLMPIQQPANYIGDSSYDFLYNEY